MAKVFISYRYTGEDPKKLNFILGQLEKSLNKCGHEVFHSMKLEKYFIDNGFTDNEIYDYCIEKQKESDVFFGFCEIPC